MGILVEVSGELLTREWKLKDVARVVKAVPDGEAVRMVFAFTQVTGIPLNKAEEEAKVLQWAAIKFDELDVSNLDFLIKDLGLLSKHFCLLFKHLGFLFRRRAMGCCEAKSWAN